VARVTKQLLKSIVKECLVEILQEGLFFEDKDVVSVSPQARMPKRKKPTEKRPALDQVKFESVVEQAVGGLTSDPVMASIFADTAKTTLQEQYAADSSPVARSKSDNSLFSPAPEEDPGEIFGEAAQNWEALAFASKKMPGT
jgi:hypothetical protein